ncbi:uncharacterized protein F5891DRAFT_1195195 [Suillus fuscotomentosus]|uniref:Uncharacterized protein n=1 Tax=Suillus fuscotomentosus TaxID=1912939 RepID=A0AAD4DV66_9AGAM|nr:uncharacterized protein F5891DRAFT_1195195 [Suillus fuscotomentosus]KAG1894490.1 hypothetical protein F5891DRAFT_1195195 [Suillus fuscotomentosus]
MSASVKGLLDIFGEEGAFIFLDRGTRSPPIVHVQTTADLIASGQPVTIVTEGGVLLATVELYKYPSLFADMIRRIADDSSTRAVYSDSVELAEHLAREIMFAPGLPYFLAMSSMTSGKLVKTFPKCLPPLHLLQHYLFRASRVRGNHLINIFSEVSANVNNRLRRRSIQAGDSLLVVHRLTANGNELGRGPPGIQGWAVRVWPDLTRFIGITGGPVAAFVLKASSSVEFLLLN